jgi:hypothetical protein
VIAHIEASFSGFGTSEAKDEAPAPTLAAVHVLKPNSNSDLADRLVALSEAPERPQPIGSNKKLLSSPVAVAALAGFTIVALMASLAWIVHGQQPFVPSAESRNTAIAEESQSTTRTSKPGVSTVPPLSAVLPKAPSTDIPASSPLAIAPALPSPGLAPPPTPAPTVIRPTVTAPTTAAPTMTAPAVTAPSAAAQTTPTAAAAQKIQPKPRNGDLPSPPEPNARPVKLTVKSEPKAEAKKSATDKSTSDAARSKEQIAQEQALKERKRQVAKASVAAPPAPRSEPVKPYPLPQAVFPEPSARLQTTESVKPIARAEPQVSAAPAKQAMATEAKTREGKGNVEALCSDRSNFLSRGYCQNQYCAESQRKNDPTCQRLRQYDTARQSSVNY